MMWMPRTRSLARNWGGLVYIQYQTEAGATVGATRTDVDEDRAEQATELPEQALEVLEARGWDREALAELAGDDDLSPQVQDKLDEMPSCYDAYLEANTVSDALPGPKLGTER